MRLLGAVLAGGRSRRFGSDKALARIGGETLLDRACATLQPHCDKVVVVGRGDVQDWPEPDRGPLGGIAGALLLAKAEGFDAVLSCPVDCADLPSDLRRRLEPGPAFVNGQPVIGLWLVDDLSAAQAILAGGRNASMRGFAERIGARAVKLGREPANINTPEDLARLEQQHGL